MKKVISLFATVMFFAGISLLFSACAKEYSYEGGPINDTIPQPPTTPEAIFSLEGSPGECTSPRINGVYTAGYKLTTGNYLELVVNVVSEGKFIIKTDTVDGFSFAVSGVFTAKGMQPVQLAGTGTPTFPRNLVFTTNAGTSSCSFPLTVLTPGVPATYVLESGNDLGCSGVSISGTYIRAVPLTSANKIRVKVYVTIAGVYAIATQTANGISFAATGEFPLPGSYTVDLLASGTPADPGNFEFQPKIVGPAPIGGEACKLNVVVQ